ncbi:TetR family transcriptional regulator [Limnohabitans sp. TS-CS-82]|jgi:AcrR family transcriptional regulator|uniref:TetR/AcrR family transcriptional regulator n=1 Tax=Limnohabitans sp. TS-CS-82 TaxID=2094193 RepID=UPI000CF25CFC|nr:TetR/AcrR family transcriptional regulator [Limnohabitans sp. TS-CS-82]PQA82251.1 TetR family transcriptional regulator [Limnohabitans sp. TS-CS-82]
MTTDTLIQRAEQTPKRERRKEARPGELLDAALDLFVEKGFSATRVEEVAARAGVSKGTLFLYFQSKEDLFKAVVRENIANKFPAWQEEFVTFKGTSADMLRYALVSWWERIGKTRASGITKLVMSEAQNFPEIAAFYQDEVIKPGNAMIHSILERGVQSGEFRDMDLEQAVHIIVAPMIFLMMWKHSMGACAASAKIVDPEQFIHMQVDVLLHGMTAKKSK